MSVEKFHYWLLSYKVTEKSTPVQLSSGHQYLQCKRQWLSESFIKSCIDKAMLSAVSHVPVNNRYCQIVSISYIGHMTKAEFNGDFDE